MNNVDINFDNEALVVRKEEALNPSVRDMFDIKAYEDVCSNLPPAPTDLDVKIEEQLQNLRVFNKIWLDEGKTVEVLDNVTVRFDQLITKKCVDKIDNTKTKPATAEAKLHIKNENDPLENGHAYITGASFTPVFSTAEDQEAFNAWYYDQLDKKSAKPNLKNLNEKLS